MAHVVFIAPRFLENTNRYVHAFADLAAAGEIVLSVVSADREASIPAALHPHVTAHYQVPDPMDPAQLTVRSMNFGQHWRTEGIVDVHYSVELPIGYFVAFLEEVYPEQIRDLQKEGEASLPIDVALAAAGYPSLQSAVADRDLAVHIENCNISRLTFRNVKFSHFNLLVLIKVI